MQLAAALGLRSSAVVAFVGAGGKKTAMGQLTVEGTDEGYDVGYTTTTAMPPPSDLPLTLTSPDEWRADLEAREPPVAFARERVVDPARVDRKVRGFEVSVVEQLSDAGLFDWLLVKADGARKREFKAPGDGEPVVPSTASHVVPVASVAAVGEPLTTDVVHRPNRVADITGLHIGDAITPEAVGTVLTHPEGGLRNAPAEASVIPLVNKADTKTQQRTARDVLTHALSQTGRCSRGVITSFTSAVCEVVSATTVQEEQR
ncbi:putative selenium-dependent hydroxylase accessory protein YqeC [Haloarcula sp. CBA1130]|uniref:selenium cofactor biosynthesis protein YqeC n=1 Tax=unclassified Haloarcula TaxID=2624677 RepID=UPI001248E2B4|nr:MULTISPECIES: selenium cofactor biosynthesis protein YqeC [unclassified Haloarcula]KAA9395999.1 putative selenium-dependent hydroxylase accessory protein YqeC [Haloarcula sp. CBA1129]KAA9400471.1 putative selenium-dependent hydroxylase accessory protein YqeC [Haloarcula sp. CBA1130]